MIKNFVHTKDIVGRRDWFISLFLALYILTAYIPKNTLPETLVRLVFYAFLGITFVKIAIRQTPLKFTPYSVWYFSFAILGLLTSFYAINSSYVFSTLYILVILWIVSFAYSQYAQSIFSFERLFAFYSYSPFFLVIYLVLNTPTLAQGERLGQALFYNANQIAMSLMISMFCVSWFLIYGNRKYLILYIVTAVILLYITALTGGRKYLFVPFIFFLLLMIFENWQTNKLRLVLLFFLYLLLMIFAAWAVMNIPALYYSVGIRFEGLLSLFNGDLANPDASTMVRYMMIDNGWRWFLQQPVLGYGLNNFAYMFSPVWYDVYSHNNYIELLVDMGIIGLLAYYTFYVYLTVRLLRIRDDHTGLRNFFLAYVMAIPIFEIGAVTYQYFPIQIFLALASAYIWLYDRKQLEHTQPLSKNARNPKPVLG